ncbi:UDP-N-acetylmuramate dehydrogenase [bacterium]|nr:UDP-N-acetylmuramate dehydrogenase [bacterium]
MRPNPFLRDSALRNIVNLELAPDADVTTLTSMSTRTTASLLAIPYDPFALRSLVRVAYQREWPMLILGGGTNTIFAQNHFDGIVVQLPRKAFGQATAMPGRIVRVGAGMELSSLLQYVRRAGLMGLEFCTMIPGSVGGALAGNAGAGNWGLCDFVESALVMTRKGQVFEVPRGAFEFKYRYSELSDVIVLEADLRLEPLKDEVAAARRREFVSKKKNQPYKCHSSGCIFKNPRDPRTGQMVSAGKLIDEAGLKGYVLNDIMVSEGHANFIVNRGNGVGEDFLAMISLIQDMVHERTGIMLELEARIVGGPLESCVLR